MNPLMQQQSKPNSDISRLMDFAKSTNPSAAKAQVEGMLKNGSLSMDRFNQLAEQAKGIASMLGIK